MTIQPHQITFHPVPFTRTGFSRLFSRIAHCRGFVFVPHGHSSSTLLRPFAPLALPLHPRYYGRPDSSPAGSSYPVQRQRSPTLLQTGLPASHGATFPAFCHQTPGASCQTPGPDFALNPQAHRNTRPNPDFHRTDCRFASGCSPPRLATTQLPSAIGIGHLPKVDLHLSNRTCSEAHSFPKRRESSPGADRATKVSPPGCLITNVPSKARQAAGNLLYPPFLNT